MHRAHGPWERGYNAIVGAGSASAGPDADMLMDFGIVALGPGESWTAPEAGEKALLLMSGAVELRWLGGQARASRSSLLDESPAVLSLCQGEVSTATAGAGGATLAVTRTENPRRFRPRFFAPSDCRSEERGKGTMREASTRIVRTVFEDSSFPESNLVLGEVVTAPGKWSSYPPHHHPQPEIYHYAIVPSQGFGLTRIGDEALVLRERDTVLIREGQVHPQVAAPGYAMWYLWVIRHLEGKRYVTPIFVDEHRWAMEPGAEIWTPPSERGEGGSPR